MQNDMISYYKNAVEEIHIQRVSESKAAFRSHVRTRFFHSSDSITNLLLKEKLAWNTSSSIRMKQ